MMKINLDLQLNESLRDKINEFSNFTFKIQHGFTVPSKTKKRERKEAGAWNCICSALDRIDETAEHCNSLDVYGGDSVGLFAFYDFLNYSQTLIDCITILGRIFEVQYNSKEEKPCFRYVKESEKGNDEKYFKYLRSLCAVHPIQTNNHPDFQDGEPEWCPYIMSWERSIILEIHPEWENPDFVAVVYRNDMQLSKHIPVYIQELFAYVEKRYAFLNEIAAGVQEYYDRHIKELRQKHIPKPDECENYVAYLKELENAEQERHGEFYHIREWQAVMRTSFEDPAMQNLLSGYQGALKEAIKSVHVKMQAMDDDCDFDLELLYPYHGTELAEYRGALEEVWNLYPTGYTENEDCDVSKFIDAEVTVNGERLNAMLTIIENAIEQDASPVELQDLAYEMLPCVNNAEYARIHLKIIEFAFHGHVRFDYMLNDWHLFVQILIANWLLGKEVDTHDELQ